MKIKVFLCSVVSACLISGCTKTESGLTGAALGTAAGAGIGYAIDGGAGGAILGGVLGGIGGGAIGSMTNKEEETEKVPQRVETRTVHYQEVEPQRPALRQQIRQEQYNLEEEKLNWRKQELEAKRLEVEKKRLELKEKELEQKRIEFEKERGKSRS